MAGVQENVPGGAPQLRTQCGNVGHKGSTCDEFYWLLIVYSVE